MLGEAAHLAEESLFVLLAVRAPGAEIVAMLFAYGQHILLR